jgi:hypothetical protein
VVSPSDSTNGDVSGVVERVVDAVPARGGRVGRDRLQMIELLAASDRPLSGGEWQEELGFAIDLRHFSIDGFCSSGRTGSARSYAHAHT